MLFEKIKFNTEEAFVTQVRLFNMPILEYYIKHNKKKKHYSLLPVLKKKKSYSYNPENEYLFYLKINSSDNCSFSCLQHWINIIGWIGGDFYIICDKEDLERKVYEKYILIIKILNL